MNARSQTFDLVSYSITKTLKMFCNLSMWAYHNFSVRRYTYAQVKDATFPCVVYYVLLIFVIS